MFCNFSFRPIARAIHLCVGFSVAKSLGYKIMRPSNNQMPKTSLFEFNYEMRYSMQNRKQEQDMWNLCWTDSIVAVDFCREMRRFQKINVSFERLLIATELYSLIHFTALSRHVWSLSQRSSRSQPESNAETLSHRLQYLPQNLVLPSGVRRKLFSLFLYSQLFISPTLSLGDAIQYSRQHKNKTFIIKPDQGSQGRGIWLTKNLKEVKMNERMICQVYLNKPLLIDGFKFDLRVYALVTSTDPLRIFVYNEGLARWVCI